VAVIHAAVADLAAGLCWRRNGMPQTWQNRVPARSAVRHEGHVAWDNAAPQLPQSFPRAGLPHRGHSCVYSDMSPLVLQAGIAVTIHRRDRGDESGE
jgi:hypothetical protein